TLVDVVGVAFRRADLPSRAKGELFVDVSALQSGVEGQGGDPCWVQRFGEDGVDRWSRRRREVSVSRGRARGQALRETLGVSAARGSRGVLDASHDEEPFGVLGQEARASL